MFSTQLYFWMQEEQEEEEDGKGTCNSEYFFLQLSKFFIYQRGTLNPSWSDARLLMLGFRHETNYC